MPWRARGRVGQTPAMETRTVRDASRLRRALMAVLILALLGGAALSRAGSRDPGPPAPTGSTAPR